MQFFVKYSRIIFAPFLLNLIVKLVFLRYN
nr:MAG TPA: hypothetical protein [Caudoviricetes sp.]DAO37717.1 MAG TPA: hypothetical protein [Caudoviricetes sp.]